ncbi:unnamed protein product [Cuscuta europaea]|uniref:DUF4283 domain-containing protein n=1 Tax=Cuscuta europaea TaxID=41803 RepID=A0A9P0Z6N7_CUSEU|nr:unnamed protein product [Cuscuta europaea]
MGWKKQSNGEVSQARVTRSRFTILENDFPALLPGSITKKPAENTSAAKLAASVVENKLANVGGDLGAAPTTPLPGQITGKAVVIATPASPGISPATDTAVANKPSAIPATIPGQITLGIKPSGTNPQWAELFRDNRAPSKGIKLKYLPPGDEVVDLSNCVLPSMVLVWGFCLVGCFTGRFPGLEAIYELVNKWGVHCTLQSHKKGWVVFKFKNEHDRTKVFTEGPYNIFGRLLILKMLSDDFTFDDEAFLKVPIWVKFPNLPLNLWNEEAMSMIASKVGVPITTDKVTQEMSNYNFVRVLIEVDITLAPCLSFPIKLPSGKTFNQVVVYETFPNFCFHCKSYGHHPFICKELGWKKIDKVMIAGGVKKGGKPKKLLNQGWIPLTPLGQYLSRGRLSRLLRGSLLPARPGNLQARPGLLSRLLLRGLF